MNKEFETGVMLDIGRKYYAPAQIKRLIAGLSELGCTDLMLHFSEDMGLGLACPAFPWLAGRAGDLCPARDDPHPDPDPSFLSAEDLAEIAGFARGKGIEIIPSFDSPGHLNYTVRRFNEYVREHGALTFWQDGNEYTAVFDGEAYVFFKNGKNLGYDRETSGRYGIFSYYLTGGESCLVHGTNNGDVARGIDLCNEVGVAFLRCVLESFARLFYSLGCRKIDIGGDEMLGFGEAVRDLGELTRWQQLDHWQEAAVRATGLASAVAYDWMVLYMNGLCDLVKKIGYTSVRLWNDEFRRTYDTGWNTDPAAHVQFRGDITVQYWSCKPQYESPVSLADSGYGLINCDCTYCYYVLLHKARDPEPTAYRKVTPQTIGEEWSPYGFGPVTEGKAAEGWYLDTSERRRSLRGAYFCVWSDDPVLRTDAEVMDELFPLLRAWKSKIGEF